MKGIKRVFAVLLTAALVVGMLALSASAESGEAGEAEDGSFAGRTLDFVREQLPSFLSGLTLLGVAVLAHAFRSSLLPILERGLGRLKGGVEEVTGETRGLLSEVRSESERLRGELNTLRERLGSEAESFAEIAGALSEMKERVGSEISLVLSQNETLLAMLKEVFTAARLPAASKLALEELYQSARSGQGGGEA